MKAIYIILITFIATALLTAVATSKYKNYQTKKDDNNIKDKLKNAFDQAAKTQIENQTKKLNEVSNNAIASKTSPANLNISNAPANMGDLAHNYELAYPKLYKTV